MHEIVEWLFEHAEDVGAALAALVALATAVAKLTPTAADDEFLVQLAQRFSFLRPKGEGLRPKLPGRKP